MKTLQQRVQEVNLRTLAAAVGENKHCLKFKGSRILQKLLHKCQNYISSQSKKFSTRPLAPLNDLIDPRHTNLGIEHRFPVHHIAPLNVIPKILTTRSVVVSGICEDGAQIYILTITSLDYDR